MFFNKDLRIGTLVKIRHSKLRQIFKNTFFIEHHRWLLIHRKKLKNVLWFFLQSLFPSLKKINNILCIFSLPHFAVRNRKLSQEICFVLPVYYTMLCPGRSKKEETNCYVLSLSTLAESHVKKQVVIFQADVTKFVRKRYCTLVLAILAYDHDAL